MNYFSNQAPIVRPTRFIGYRHHLAKMYRMLENDTGNVHVLGPARSGKTSLLNVFSNKDVAAEFMGDGAAETVFAVIRMRDVYESPDDLMDAIRHCLEREARREGVGLQPSGAGEPYAVLLDVLEQFVDAGKRVVVCFDDADKFADSERYDVTCFNRLRSLQERGLVAYVALSRRPLALISQSVKTSKWNLTFSSSLVIDGLKAPEVAAYIEGLPERPEGITAAVLSWLIRDVSGGQPGPLRRALACLWEQGGEAKAELTPRLREEMEQEFASRFNDVKAVALQAAHRELDRLSEADQDELLYEGIARRRINGTVALTTPLVGELLQWWLQEESKKRFPEGAPGDWRSMGGVWERMREDARDMLRSSEWVFVTAAEETWYDYAGAATCLYKAIEVEARQGICGWLYNNTPERVRMGREAKLIPWHLLTAGQMRRYLSDCADRLGGRLGPGGPRRLRNVAGILNKMLSTGGRNDFIHSKPMNSTEFQRLRLMAIQERWFEKIVEAREGLGS